MVQNKINLKLEIIDITRSFSNNNATNKYRILLDYQIVKNKKDNSMLVGFCRNQYLGYLAFFSLIKTFKTTFDR